MKKIVIFIIVWIIICIGVLAFLSLRGGDEDKTVITPPVSQPEDTTPKPDPEVEIESGAVGTDGRPLDSEPMEHVDENAIPAEDDVSIPPGAVNWSDIVSVNKNAKRFAFALAELDHRNDWVGMDDILSGEAKEQYEGYHQAINDHINDGDNAPIPKPALWSMNAYENEYGERIVDVTVRVFEGRLNSKNYTDRLVTMTFTPNKPLINKFTMTQAY